MAGNASSGPGDLYTEKPFIAQLILSKVIADFIIWQNWQQSSLLAGKRIRTTWEDSKVRIHPPIRSNSLISKLVHNSDTSLPLAELPSSSTTRNGLLAMSLKRFTVYISSVSCCRSTACRSFWASDLLETLLLLLCCSTSSHLFGVVFFCNPVFIEVLSTHSLMDSVTSDGVGTALASSVVPACWFRGEVLLSLFYILLT